MPAPNRKKSAAEVKQNGVKLELQGKERTVLFDMNAFIVLEERFGSVDAAMQAMGSGSMKAFRTLIWAGLLHENPELTELEVGAMIDMASMNKLSAVLDSAIVDNTPQPEEGTAGK